MVGFVCLFSALYKEQFNVSILFMLLVENDDVADITLSERLGESHVVKSAWLDNGALRVLIYSPTAEGIEGGR